MDFYWIPPSSNYKLLEAYPLADYLPCHGKLKVDLYVLIVGY